MFPALWAFSMSTSSLETALYNQNQKLANYSSSSCLLHEPAIIYAENVGQQLELEHTIAGFLVHLSLIPAHSINFYPNAS